MKLNKQIKAIPTVYNGVSFRSKLEAHWARFFDSIGINWTYEIEGYKFSGDIAYLPDFWLPDCKTFFEVKGPLSEKDLTKMRKLAEAVAPRGIMVAVGSVVIPDSLGLVYPIPFFCGDEWCVEDGKGIICDRDYVDIAVCNKCKTPYIVYLWQGWDCRNCGFYDGNNTSGNNIIHEKNTYKKFSY